MKKLKIIVTGGAGFIGSWVVDCLLKKMGDQIKEIIIVDTLIRGSKKNLSDALKDRRVKLVNKDIRNVKAMHKIIKGADYVIHEAAIKNITCDENPRLCLEILIDGTFNLMEACVKHKVKKFIFNSSASVYGQPLKIPMTETDRYNNDAFYGSAKIANEQLAKAFKKNFGLNYIGFRPFNVYGPRMDISGIYTDVFIKWLNAIDKGEHPVIYGDGKNTLDFIYAEDVAQATVMALSSTINEGFYNLGSGREVSLNKLAGLIINSVGSKLKPVHRNRPRGSNYVTRRKASIMKTKKELGFVATTGLKKGLSALVEWRKIEQKK